MEHPSRTYLKRVMKNFWKTKWVPGRSPEIWANVYQRNYRDRERIGQALLKLELEKRITPEQKANLSKMLESPDHENIYMAISVMAGLAPKKFQRRERSR